MDDKRICCRSGVIREINNGMLTEEIKLKVSL